MCPKEATLIRLMNGELPRVQARDATEHVRACATCGARYARLRVTWEALGQWEVAPPASDLCGQILRAAAAAEAAPVAAPSDGSFWIRVAAAVVLTAGAGVAVAFVMTRAEDAGRYANVGHEQVVHVLGLEALAGEGALTAIFEPIAETPEGEAVEEEQS
jgi:hypothetical protein